MLFITLTVTLCSFGMLILGTPLLGSFDQILIKFFTFSFNFCSSTYRVAENYRFRWGANFRCFSSNLYHVLFTFSSSTYRMVETYDSRWVARFSRFLIDFSWFLIIFSSILHHFCALFDAITFDLTIFRASREHDPKLWSWSFCWYFFHRFCIIFARFLMQSPSTWR